MKSLKHYDYEIKIEHCWECTQKKGVRIFHCQIATNKPEIKVWANEPIPKFCPLPDVTPTNNKER